MEQEAGEDGVQTLSHRKGGEKMVETPLRGIARRKHHLTVDHRGWFSVPILASLQIPAMTDGANTTDSLLDFHFLKVLLHLDPFLNGDICSYLVAQ